MLLSKRYNKVFFHKRQVFYFDKKDFYSIIRDMADLTPKEFKAQLKPLTQVIGIDYGTKRIGIAVSDLMRVAATPVAIINSFAELDKILSDRTVGGFVVGLPKQMNGQEGAQAALTREWAQKLQARYHLPVLFWDERLSSSAVTRVFVEQADISRKKQKESLDKAAAAYILQGALDLLAGF